MQALKATQAREIKKSDITEAETLVFEGRIIKQTGRQEMKPGEFYFRPTAVPVMVNPNWLKKLFGAKPRESFEIIRAIVIACPYCKSPIMTSQMHKMVRRKPLTIENKITCPYNQEKPHSFKVVEGKIIAA